ncbi:MAG: hypothetical protein Q4D63_01930 [Neisseria animaloris]|nr:hypothetical protein [Neisseria animaloris]
MADSGQHKDLLFAGLAREARVAGLPIGVATLFMVAGTVVFITLYMMSMTVTAVIMIAVAYACLMALTYKEDRGVHYFLGNWQRKRKNSSRAFKGISYETAYRFSKGSPFKFSEDADKENMENEFIPYLHHVTPEVIKTVTGDLMTVLKLDGFNFETESYHDLEILKRQRADLFRQLESRYVVQVHYVRRQVSPEKTAETANDFFNDFSEAYYQRQKQQTMFANDIYLTLLARAKNPNDPPWLRMKAAFLMQNGHDEELLKELISTRDQVMTLLKRSSPRVLSVYRKDGVEYCETLTFLSMLLNADPYPVPVLKEEIRRYLPISRRIFQENGVIRFQLADGSVKLASIFGLPTRTYPEVTDHTMIDDFLKVNHELIISESFAMMDRQGSTSLTKRKQGQLENSADDSVSQIEDIDEALDDLASGRMINGFFSFNVMVLGKSAEEFKKGVEKVREAFASAHLLPKREDLIAEPSFYSMLPGNMRYFQRPAIINTRNFAGFASMHNTRTGRKDGNHWGEHIICLKTISNTPYYFNFHEGDVGHTRFIAPTGGGKTTALNAMLAAALKHDPYIFHFDFEYSAAVFMKALDGQHFELSPAERTGWNPFHLDDTPKNREFLFRLMSFIGMRYNENGVLKPLTASEEKQIHEMIDYAYRVDKPLRKLGNLVGLLGIPTEGSLREQIDKWCNDGRLANFFDNDEDVFSLEGNKRFCFEMKNIIGNSEMLVAASMYIFHRIDLAMATAKPFIVVMEEGQRYIEHEYNRHWLKVMLTTYRRRNGMVVFVTPTPETVVEDDNLRQQFKTSVLFPNPKAAEKTYMGANGLMCSEKEYAWLRETDGRTTRQFLIKNSNESAISSMDLTGMNHYINVFSGNEQKFNLLVRLMKDNGYQRYAEWKEAYENACELL